MCLRICTGFKEVSLRETHLWEHFGRADQIALITCLKNLNVSAAFLRNDKNLHESGPRSSRWRSFWHFGSEKCGGFYICRRKLHHILHNKDLKDNSDSYKQGVECWICGSTDEEKGIWVANHRFPNIASQKKRSRRKLSQVLLQKSRKSAKSRRGREKGDGKKLVINCRKLFYDILWRFLWRFMQWNKETEIVTKCRQFAVKCRKLSWSLLQIVVTFFFPSPSCHPLFKFGFRRGKAARRSLGRGMKIAALQRFQNRGVFNSGFLKRAWVQTCLRAWYQVRFLEVFLAF